jgi:hypothetical protein
LAGQRNVAAALFQLENSRRPEDIERVLASLIHWLAAAEQDSLRRAFLVWLTRALLPARVPGAELPNANDLREMRAMLAERVKTWTEEWKQQGVPLPISVHEQAAKERLEAVCRPCYEWYKRRLCTTEPGKRRHHDPR